MTWMKLETLVRSNPKLVATIAATGHCNAAWLWLCANAYARDALTDGFVPDFMVATLVPGLPAKLLKALPAVLVRHGLWHVADGGYQIHDFLDHNPSKDDIEAGREWDRVRKSLYADKDLLQQIRSRDRDCCRYCGRQVNWRDRRGEGGGQYDHVVPRGPNTLDNVVIACRKCNAQKGGRTPAQAGMELIPVAGESLNQNQVGTSSPYAGAGAPSSSLSPSLVVDDPVSTKNPEGGLGETTPRLHRLGVVDRARALGIEPPGQWDRQHASHALRADFCSSFVCLPTAVHAEFVTRVVSAGSSQAEAEASVRAWALDVKARWAGEIPGEDSFKFWRAEWAATHPARRASSTPAPGAGLDALISAASAGKAVARG